MNGLLRRYRLFHRLLCLLLTALSVVTPRMLAAQQPAAPAKPLDTSFALPNASIIVALRPAQILNCPFAQLYPTEILQAAAMKETGLDPLAAEQVLVTFAPPGYAVVAHFAAPAELKAGPMTTHTRTGKLDDRQYLQSVDPNPLAPSFYQPDGATLVAGPDSTIRQLAGASAAPPADSLLAKFAAASQNDDLLAMIDVASLRPLVNMAVMQAPLPPELAELRNIPNLVKTIQLRVNLTQQTTSELVVTANNEADAQQLVFMFESYKQRISAQAAAEAERALASEDVIEQAQGRYMQRMIKLGDEQAQLPRVGDQIIVFRTDGSSDQNNQAVTLAVAGVLVALLLPAVQAAREAARRNSSMNNVKQLLLGLLNYESAKQHFPAHAIYSADGKPLLSWRVAILPYIEQQALYNQFHLDEPWDSEHNKTLIAQMPELFLDPSSGLLPIDGKTHYLGVAGEHMLFDGTAEGRSIRTVVDGTSNSIAIVQVNDANAVTWTQPEDLRLDPQNPLANIGLLHSGIFLAGFCDGHVQSISQSIDWATFQALLTVDGEEIVQLP
jgi:hypothetical protein